MIIAYEKVVDSILKADISVGDYVKIENHKARIIQLAIISKGFNSKTRDIELAFKNRSAEYQIFTSYLSDLNKLWSTCNSSFPPGIERLRVNDQQDLIMLLYLIEQSLSLRTPGLKIFNLLDLFFVMWLSKIYCQIFINVEPNLRI